MYTDMQQIFNNIPQKSCGKLKIHFCILRTTLIMFTKKKKKDPKKNSLKINKISLHSLWGFKFGLLKFGTSFVLFLYIWLLFLELPYLT